MGYLFDLRSLYILQRVLTGTLLIKCSHFCLNSGPLISFEFIIPKSSHWHVTASLFDYCGICAVAYFLVLLVLTGNRRRQHHFIPLYVPFALERRHLPADLDLVVWDTRPTLLLQPPTAILEQGLLTKNAVVSFFREDAILVITQLSEILLLVDQRR